MKDKEEIFNKISSLAYIKETGENAKVLANDIDTIINYINKLQEVNTDMIKPLSHPFDMTQPLRDDISHEQNHINEFAKIAPLFTDNQYLVPKVLDSEK